jgi:hypothetical protein
MPGSAWAVYVAMKVTSDVVPGLQLAQREYEVSRREEAARSAEELARRYSAREEELWRREQELQTAELSAAKAQLATEQVRGHARSRRAAWQPWTQAGSVQGVPQLAPTCRLTTSAPGRHGTARQARKEAEALRDAYRERAERLASRVREVDEGAAGERQRLDAAVGDLEERRRALALEMHVRGCAP